MTEAGPPEQVAPYIRARAAGEVDGGRILRRLLGAATVVLAVITVVTAIGAARQDSGRSRLKRDGVAVTVTVTGCEGVSSGIGQAIVSYLCHGSYTLDGQRYDEVIGGNRRPHADGDVLAGVAVPGHPGLLATPDAVRAPLSPWSPYVTPIILGAVTVALGLLLALLLRRRARAGPPAPGRP